MKLLLDNDSLFPNGESSINDLSGSINKDIPLLMRCYFLRSRSLDKIVEISK